MFSLFEGLTALVTNVIPLLCVDELDMPLQVAVDHEDLVAARVRAWSLPHLLVMLLDVFLETIGSSVDSRTALIWTLVDVGELLPFRFELVLPAWLGSRFLSDFGLLWGL